MEPRGRAIVWLRFLIVPAWIAATAMAVAHLPSAFEAEASELGSLLPHSSEALEVERKAIKTFGLPLLSRTMVVARQPSGFSAAQASAAARYIAAADRSEGPRAVKAVPLTDAPGMLGTGRAGDHDRRLPLSRPRTERRRIPGKRRAIRGRPRARQLGAVGEGDRRAARRPGRKPRSPKAI